MRETEFLLIAVHSNDIRTSYINAKTNNTPGNSKYRLRGNRDQTDNHITSECSKLAQKENKIRCNWVGKMIHWELCKILKFNLTIKSNFALENHTQKILWNFEIQTSHSISVWMPEVMLINKKKTSRLVIFAAPTDHCVKTKENEKVDEYVNLAREVKKLCNMKVTVITFLVCLLGTVPKIMEKRLMEVEISGRIETILIIALLRSAGI